MKIKNMTSSKGNKAAKQFIVEGSTIWVMINGQQEQYQGDMFQSYESNIAFKLANGTVFLDPEYWDYSRTTGEYRNIFLDETKAETEAKIAAGKYLLVDLNE